MKVIPAIYIRTQKDSYFHATMSCRLGGIRIYNNDRYQVNTVQFVINKEKYPCPDCWVPGGYDAVNDILAGRE